MATSTVQTIGQRIKQLREKNHLTQSQVAEKLFVTQQTVARWESDKHQPPIKAIQDLAALFNVNSSYFFGENLVIMHKINLLALFGSLVFNLLFFWIIAVFIATFFLTMWGFILGCIASPVIILAHLGKPFTWGRFGITVLMMGFGAISLPIAWMITKYLAKVLRAYYRYNVSSIIYEIVPNQAPAQQSRKGDHHD